MPFAIHVFRSTLLCTLLLGWLQYATAQQASGKLITIDDLYRLDTPTSPILLPDGKNLAYIRQWIDPMKKVDRSSLWLVEGKRENARAIEEGEPDARAPIFSPDGKWIAFLSTRSRPDGWKQTQPVPLSSDPATDVWVIPTSGGKAIPLAGKDKPYGRVFNDGFFGRIAFDRDGKRLVFVADDGKDLRTKQEIENNVEIVRPDQGEGYTGYRAAQIWIAHLDAKPGEFAASKIERLTNDDVWYGDPQWTPDGKAIVVHANRTDDRESVRYSINKNYDIWAIDIASKKLKQLTNGPGPEVSPRISPDGKKIICLSVPRKGSHRDVFNFALIDLSGDEPKTRILFDHHGPDADKAPHVPPYYPLPTECWEDDGHLHYTNEAGTISQLMRLDLESGEAGSLREREGPQIESRPIGRRQFRAFLTPQGNVFLKDRSLAGGMAIAWKSEDGLQLEGILTRPPAATNAKAPYKLVVYPHGGPHSRATLGFDFTVQVLAANGYAVFQPNFRGSSGYGQKFIDADRFDLGGGDMKDIMSGVDHLIKEGIADKDRLFVQGTSYGGFMTCWLVGHDNRFKAAVAINAVTDLNMMWGLTDIQSWTEWEFGGPPWKVPDLMRKHSPIAYGDKVKTPTLILHSRDDRRCPLPMGRAFHQALEANKVETQMVIYPDEGHGIRQPKHREDVLRRMLDWFAKYDK
jgi:dipeptidyl aminopeptidase/acylaminoacyl peptidase